MDIASIPLWNSDGLLPPMNGDSLTKQGQSPYRCSLVELIDRFGLTTERSQLLDGLFRYRAALHDLGVDTGFQWINGSFVENKEKKLNKAPNDIDLVTFFQVPDLLQMRSGEPEVAQIFDVAFTKKEFGLDAHVSPLGNKLTAKTAREITYWAGQWGHTRAGQWKGFVEVPLTSENDLEAREYLRKLSESL